MAGQVHLEITGAIATLTNDNPEKHNAFDDSMDAELFAALAELSGRNDIRAIIWRGEDLHGLRVEMLGRSARTRRR